MIFAVTECSFDDDNAEVWLSDNVGFLSLLVTDNGAIYFQWL